MDTKSLAGSIESPALWGAGGVGLLATLLALFVRPGLFVDQAIGGLVYGMILVLIALGLSLILGLMNIVNFAHGALFMLGAYVAYHVVAILQLPFVVALVVAPLAVGVVGIAIEVLVLRRLYDQEPLVGFLATFGLTLMLEEAIRAQWGSTPLSFDMPGILATSFELWLPVVGTITTISRFRLFTVVVSAITVVGVFALIKYTDFGLTVRGGVQDAEMTEFLGVNLPFRFTAMFFLGAVIAGLGGVLRGAAVGLQPNLGTSFIILTFVVVVVGGIGSIFGSVVAGIVIGECVFLTPVVLSALADVTGVAAVNVPGIGGLVPYLVMIAVLLARPRGLFGKEGFLE